MSCKNYGLATLVHAHMATEVLETLHPGETGLCWSGMHIIKVWLKRLITFASSQPGDRGFLGGVYMHYRSLALIPGSCVSRERGSLVHTVCICTVLGFIGVCNISFVTLLNFVSHLKISCHQHFGNFYCSTST